MDSAWPMLLFMGFLFVTMGLILIMGYRWVETERTEESAARGVPLHAAGSRFFAKLEPDRGVRPAANVEDSLVEDSFVANIEGYVKREQRLAAGFVADPSLENLYRPAERAVSEANVERYLRREERLAAEFVSNPSVENLYRPTERRLWLT